jgi:hypothetical protein
MNGTKRAELLRGIRESEGVDIPPNTGEAISSGVAPFDSGHPGSAAISTRQT